MTDVRAHWDDRWTANDHHAMSWFQTDPQPSLDLLEGVTPAGAAVVDVGGGTSALADRLLADGYRPTVVDIAGPALDETRRRLGDRAAEGDLVMADVRTLDLDRTFATWHDRAVLHFLTDAEDRTAYVAALGRHVPPGGHAVIGTFAPDGPTHCSGLPVRRYATADLLRLTADLDPVLVEDRHVVHETPSGATQPFTFVVIRRG